MEIFWFLMGMFVGIIILKWDEKSKKNESQEEAKNTSEEEKLSPMTLRNGMNVTRTDKPTFAEQLVNVMNYNGENQKEGDFDEQEN